VSRDRAPRDYHSGAGGPPLLPRDLCLSTFVPSARSSGAELYWEKAGSGPRLLFCNGSGMTVDNGRPLLEIVGQGLELLAWDYRGLGGSSRVSAPYTMADLANDAVAVLDAAGWDSCCLMGLSFGGMVAQEFAVAHPQRVQRLALACTSAGGECGASYPLERLAELEEAERSARSRTLLDERWDERWLADHPADSGLAQGVMVNRDQLDPEGAPGRRMQMLARAGHDVCERLGAIDCPTLVGYGRYDGIAPPANSRAIASRIRGAQLRGYDGGHLFIVQDPTALPDFAAFLAAQ
jgi:pimeloyl-ACP methyl ester carboxylesterase